MIAYRAGSYCPGCGRSQWIIGLSTAECAFCTAAVPLAGASNAQRPVTVRGIGKGGGSVRRMAAA